MRRSGVRSSSPPPGNQRGRQRATPDFFKPGKAWEMNLRHWPPQKNRIEAGRAAARPDISDVVGLAGLVQVTCRAGPPSSAGAEDGHGPARRAPACTGDGSVNRCATAEVRKPLRPADECGLRRCDIEDQRAVDASRESPCPACRHASPALYAGDPCQAAKMSDRPYPAIQEAASRRAWRLKRAGARRPCRAAVGCATARRW